MGEVAVTWTASDPNGDPITHYTVTAQPDSGPTRSGQVTGTSVVFDGLAEGQGYTFTVTATNGVGTSSPSVPSNRVVPFGPPDSPRTWPTP